MERERGRERRRESVREKEIEREKREEKEKRERRERRRESVREKEIEREKREEKERERERKREIERDGERLWFHYLHGCLRHVICYDGEVHSVGQQHCHAHPNLLPSIGRQVEHK